MISSYIVRNSLEQLFREDKSNDLNFHLMAEKVANPPYRKKFYLAQHLDPF